MLQFLNFRREQQSLEHKFTKKRLVNPLFRGLTQERFNKRRSSQQSTPTSPERNSTSPESPQPVSKIRALGICLAS